MVADRLNNPRGLELDGDALYVAEAGRGGPTCLPPPDEVCIGFTSTVTKVDDGRQRRVVTGMVSVAGPDGTFATGADDVSVADRGGGLFTIITSGPCELALPLPPEAVRQLAAGSGSGSRKIWRLSKAATVLSSSSESMMTIKRTL